MDVHEREVEAAERLFAQTLILVLGFKGAELRGSKELNYLEATCG